MEAQDLMGGTFSIVVILFMFVLAILILLMPFFIYGTNKRTKETSQKLDETNQLLSKIQVSMEK